MLNRSRTSEALAELSIFSYLRHRSSLVKLLGRSPVCNLRSVHPHKAHEHRQGFHHSVAGQGKESPLQMPEKVNAHIWYRHPRLPPSHLWP